MKTFIPYIVLLLFVVACQSTDQPPARPAKEPKLLKEVQVQHSFADPNTKDVFRLRLTGDSLLTATLTFSITDAAGKVLFTEQFPSLALLDSGIMQADTEPTDADRERYIQQQMDTFFEEKDFTQPAVPTDAEFEAEYSDEKIWAALRGDPTAVGFYYKLYEEDGRSIAYDKAQQKVVRYFNCC